VTVQRVRTRVAALAGAGVTAALLLLPVPVRAAEGESIVVGMSAESWYRPAGQPLPSTYPEGFVHVGALAGVEESRTYLGLDLSRLPADAELVAGTLTLPIVAESTAGTSFPESAKVRACHVASVVADGVAGETAGAPEPVCAITAPAVYVAAEGEAPAALVIDLAPFIALWSRGVASLAVLVEEELTPTETWHVAFSRRDREAPDAIPISAQLELGRDAEAEADVADDFEPPAASSSGGFTAPRLDASASFAAPPLAAPIEPQVAVTERAPVIMTQPVVSVVAGGYAYPVVLLLPLAAAAAIAWAGRALTRDFALLEA
jgi:hypothetical protein